MGVSFALQPLISWGKFSATHFIGGCVDQRVHLEKILKKSELSVASAKMQQQQFGGLVLRLRRGIRNNNNKEVEFNLSKDSSYNTLH